MSLSTHIVGVGGYLPERIMSNDELATIVDTTDDWIRERTGITQRHIIAKDEYTSDLASRAAQQALDDAGLRIDDIDALIVATTTPDMVFPSTASIVQHKLGGKGFPAWDIQAVCSGFVYGLAQADGMMKGGMFKRVLLIGAESMSRIVAWSDRNTCVLFGDGSYRDLLMAKHAHPGASPNNDRLDMNTDAAGVAAVSMKGNEVFRFAVTKLGEVVDEVLTQHHLSKEDLDWLVPHQANIRILNATAKKLKMSTDQVALTVAKHANTSAASVPMALNDLYRQGKIEAGQLLLLEAFAGGFAWGANLIRWSK